MKVLREESELGKRFQEVEEFLRKKGVTISSPHSLFVSFKLKNGREMMFKLVDTEGGGTPTDIPRVFTSERLAVDE